MNTSFFNACVQYIYDPHPALKNCAVPFWQGQQTWISDIFDTVFGEVLGPGWDTYCSNPANADYCAMKEQEFMDAEEAEDHAYNQIDFWQGYQG